MTKTVAVDFGERKLDIAVPDSAVVAEFTDPKFAPDPAAAVQKALAEPLGLPPLAQLARPGMRVAIGFDDITRPANEYALQRAGAVYLAGTSNPGAFRKLGITPTADFDSAWKAAKRIVGNDPQVVFAPTFWSRPRIKFSVESGAARA